MASGVRATEGLGIDEMATKDQSLTYFYRDGLSGSSGSVETAPEAPGIWVSSVLPAAWLCNPSPPW